MIISLEAILNVDYNVIMTKIGIYILLLIIKIGEGIKFEQDQSNSNISNVNVYINIYFPSSYMC